MKREWVSEGFVRRCALAGLMAALYGFGPGARATDLLVENFDGTLPAPMGGWSGGGVSGVSYDFVDGVGVGGSTAMQLKATWLDLGGYAGMLYQNPWVPGTEGATLANTLVSFDLKVNVPEIYGMSIGVQSWTYDADWNWTHPTASLLELVTYPAYDLPEEFETWTFWMADPAWIVDPYSSPWDGYFDPAGNIYQVLFGTTGWLSLPLYDGVSREEILTVDNLRIWTVPHIQVTSITPEYLWPPNHKMVEATIEYTVTDPLAEVASTTLTVTSNEPANGLGDGDTSPDWEVLDAHRVLLRAERSGKGQGRVYTVTITATDTLGNQTHEHVIMVVPKSQGSK